MHEVRESSNCENLRHSPIMTMYLRAFHDIPAYDATIVL